MASDVFKAGWVPRLLLNHWVQLALITPVMFYTGWPIHRTGWLALAHRSADMNSLITLGTIAAYGYSLLVTVAPGLLPAGVRGVYFEAVGVILTLILLGRLIETRAKAGTGPGDPRAARPAGPHRPGGPRRHRGRDPGSRTWWSATRSSSGPGRRSRSTRSCCPARRRWTSRWSPASRCRSPSAPGTPSSAPRSTAPGRCGCGPTKVGADTMLAQIIQLVQQAQASKAPDPAAGRRGVRLLRARGHRHRDRHVRGLVHRRARPRRSPWRWCRRSRC